MTPEERLRSLGKVSNVSRLEALGLWQETSIAQRLGGDQYWQLGVDGLSFGDSTNVSNILDQKPAKLMYQMLGRIHYLHAEQDREHSFDFRACEKGSVSEPSELM